MPLVGHKWHMQESEYLAAQLQSDYNFKVIRKIKKNISYIIYWDIDAELLQLRENTNNHIGNVTYTHQSVSLVLKGEKIK